jgi:phage terminase large subunit-like protein
MKVEQAVLRAHRAFDLKAVGYDPHQAALMSQRLELQKVRMQEMVFTGKNLDLMASTLLDVFRTRRITMFEDKILLADLGKLCIEERPFGYKLTAIKDEFGHADRAIALSIALPLAVEQAGVVPLQIGVWSTGDQGISAFEVAMQRHEYNQTLFDADQAILSRPDSDQDDMREAFRLCGR